VKVTLNLFPYGRFPESNDLAPAGTEVEVSNQSEERDQHLRSSLGRPRWPTRFQPSEGGNDGVYAWCGGSLRTAYL